MTAIDCTASALMLVNTTHQLIHVLVVHRTRSAAQTACVTQVLVRHALQVLLPVLPEQVCVQILQQQHAYVTQDLSAGKLVATIVLILSSMMGQDCIVKVAMTILQKILGHPYPDHSVFVTLVILKMLQERVVLALQVDINLILVTWHVLIVLWGHT